MSKLAIWKSKSQLLRTTLTVESRYRLYLHSPLSSCNVPKCVTSPARVPRPISTCLDIGCLLRLRQCYKWDTVGRAGRCYDLFTGSIATSREASLPCTRRKYVLKIMKPGEFADYGFAQTGGQWYHSLRPLVTSLPPLSFEFSTSNIDNSRKPIYQTHAFVFLDRPIKVYFGVGEPGTRHQNRA